MSRGPTEGQQTLDGAEVKLCAVCGRPFRFLRRDARYCSGACRMVAQRARNGARTAPRRWTSEVRPRQEGR